MITHIRVKNFKSWRDSDIVKLAPLTGFFGTNSSGKSSLLQMLLLLKQTAENSDVKRALFLGNPNSLVNLDNFSKVVHSLGVPVELGFGCKLEDPRPIYTSLKDEPPSMLMMAGFTFDTTLQEGAGIPIVENFRYRIDPNGILEIVWERQNLFFGNQIDGSSFETIPLEDTRNCYGTPLSTKGKPYHFLKQFSSAFEELFCDVYYLGTIRHAAPQHYHGANQQRKRTGTWGNEMIRTLFTAYLKRQVSPHEKEQIPLERQISKWLQSMGLAYGFVIKPRGTQTVRDYQIHIQKSQTDVKTTSDDPSSGLIELLPVLVLCYCAPEGSTLIIEHPGSLLHPMAQAQLADLFLEVITERNLQILIESHSEHLLTRLQLRIAEGKIPTNDTALYFCENENGVSTINSLDVDELGNIKNWPKNFFGNVRGDLVKMAREQMKRQKKAED